MISLEIPEELYLMLDFIPAVGKSNNSIDTEKCGILRSVAKTWRRVDNPAVIIYFNTQENKTKFIMEHM